MKPNFMREETVAQWIIFSRILQRLEEICDYDAMQLFQAVYYANTDDGRETLESLDKYNGRAA